jgi:hypothetical protein
MYGITLELEKLPDAVLQPALEKIHAALKRDGAAAFCARVKPAFDKFVAGIRR